MIKEESAKDPLFKKIADHYLDFRKKYAIWGDAQVLKPTYQGLSKWRSVLRRPRSAAIEAAPASRRRCRPAHRRDTLGVGGPKQ